MNMLKGSVFYLGNVSSDLLLALAVLERLVGKPIYAVALFILIFLCDACGVLHL